MQVLAAGLFIADNARESGEQIRVYGEDDRLLATFSGEEGMPHYGGWAFRGVIAAVPIHRVEFDEHSGGDDICIKDPTFGLISE
jgi:hypothetical protein